MENAPVRKLPETKITFLNLTPQLGTPRGSPTEEPGLPAKPLEPLPEKPPEPAVAAKPPEPPPPKVVPIEPPKPKIVKKPKPKKPSPAVKIGKPKVAPRTPKVKAPDQAKITEALAKIDTQLEERERQLKEPSPPTAPAGTTTGGPGGVGSPAGKINARDPGYARYQSAVRSKIIRNWVRTHAGGETQKLRASIRVRINASGTVISKSFSKRSGDPSFDNSALRAVERASPFPPPPPGVKQEALKEGFVVVFSSRVLGRR